LKLKIDILAEYEPGMKGKFFLATSTIRKWHMNKDKLFNVSMIQMYRQKWQHG
jgi:hypothetical protein